jgi:hypothetical protein
MAKRKTCGDCGTKEGQLHILGCDMERCPFCGNQLITYKDRGADALAGKISMRAYSRLLRTRTSMKW